MVLCPRQPPESTSICFSHFCQWRQKAHSPLTNTVFFSNCSGLLKCIKMGSHQFTTIFTTSSNACACISFRKHGSASGWVYGSDQIAERNRNKNIYFYSGNCQNTEISVCTFQFYESLYKYGRTFTHATVQKCCHLTQLTVLPSMTWLLDDKMTSTVAESLKETKPNPLDLPVCGFFMTIQSVISPN